MAGDWIKMRPSLVTSPKVNGIARILEENRRVADVLTTDYSGVMSDVVTRNVMRHVTVASLLMVWGAANEHTKDGVFNNADLSDLDDIAGIPGFGSAMAAVGWATYDEGSNSVSLPNFNEYNTSGASRSATAKSAAERQKEYRDRKKSQNSDVTSDVTNDVTSDRREEKRREEKKEQKTASKDDLLTGISPQVAKDFAALRVRLRAPITKTAMAGIRREADKAGISMESALVACCERGWRGFKAEWVTAGSAPVIAAGGGRREL